jgi:metal-responsive CopG/Arc/MetJ family transcriptional regulator
MSPERKSAMISLRLPADLVERLDYVTRNNARDIRSRSEAIHCAILAWLPAEEARLTSLGLTPPKKAR